MSGKFEPYDTYQDSQLDWLGQIPNHWELRRLGGFFNERREKVSDKDFPPLSVTMQGIVPQLENAAKTKDGDNRKLVRLGDFVINSRSDRKGSSGVSPLDGSVSLIAIVLEPSGMVPEYVHHLLRSEAFQEEFYRFGKGIVADLWSTNYSAMKNITIPVMSADEQQQIASFLDYETAKIDALIEKQQQLIALLGEKRQAVISHAVTKGLNPDAPMRDSGVEWLGEVPEHWEVAKTKYLFWCAGGFAFPSKGFVEEGVPVIRISNIQGNRIDTKNLVYWPEGAESSLAEYRMREGDLLFCMTGAALGKTGVVGSDLEGAFVNQRVGRLDLVKIIPVLKEYLRFYFVSKHFEEEIKSLGKGLTDNFPNISSSQIANIRTCVPSLEEQRKIVEAIEQESGKFDVLISKADEASELLQERRTALISAAVTGKIDVRGWKPPKETEA